MGRWRRTTACERAGQWISLELDGELSQMEHAALERHLASCDRCRSLGLEVRGFTSLLREAPLVEPSRRVVAHAPARARKVRRVAAMLAFAVVGAAAAVTGVVVPHGGNASQSALAFRSVQEQREFAHVEAQRIEPAAFQPAPPSVPTFAARVLV